MSESSHPAPPEGVAVIGMACRFPGAADPRAYWRNLSRGVESIRRLSDEELTASGVAPELLRDPRYVKASPVLDDPAGFDAGFFGCSPREAALMDPQHRLFLEVAWEAFEDAGRRPDTHPGPVGVYAGAGGVVTSYLVDRLQRAPEIAGATGELAHIVNDKDFLPTRVSYLLDLRGPSVNVQTACSTSAVALHLACQSLELGECDLALAGASVVRVPQIAGYLYQESGILSPDGHCRAFDAGAAGTVFGSGAGAVVLKPLADAVADGDHVWAVIRSSAINNDGGRKVSYTASSQEGQARAAAESLAFAEIDARTIGYVEAHGTATLMGDPLEIKALTQAFRQSTADTGYCAVASVKSNLGHLEQAAGIAGLIKVALSLHHRQIPASLHFEEPNPQIDFDGSPFYVNRTLADWPAGGAPRRAGLNSLGLGGTNAFLVLEEAPAAATGDPGDEDRPYVLALSARSAGALARAGERLAGHLAEHPELAAADVCFTANTGRAVFDHRRAVTGTSAAELARRLAAAAAPAASSSQAREVAFLFTGQGAQYAGMARRLHDTQPVFRQTLVRCDEVLRPILGEPLADVLWPAAEDGRLDQTGWTQPALFAVEVSLARLLESWGIVPDAVLGHSVGEVAAACVAGVLTLEDGLRWIAERARLMQSLPASGGMVAVWADADATRRVLADALGEKGSKEVSIAAVNSPESTVVAGPVAALETVVEVLDREGVRHRPLAVSHAFHSPLVEPILGRLEAAAARADHAAPRIPLVTNVTGDFAGADTLGPAYWRDHARRPVRFADGVRALWDAGCRVFVEVGPGRSLLGLAGQCLGVEDGAAPRWLPTLVSGSDEPMLLSTTVAALWEEGVDVDWTAFDPAGRRRVSLPTYPFERQRYWLEGTSGAAPRRGAGAAHPLLGRRLPSPLPEAQFESWLSLAALPYLDDHRMYGLPVLPTTATLEMATAAAEAVLGPGPHALENLVYSQALVLPDDRDAEGAGGDGLSVQLVVTPERDGRAAFRLASHDPAGAADAWRQHMTGTMTRAAATGDAPGDATPRRLRERLPETDAAAFYRVIARAGLQYGARFQGIDGLWRGDGEALARVRLPRDLAGESGYRAHPALLDACLHLYAALVDESFSGGEAPDPVYLPISLERCQLLGPLPAEVWSHAVRRPESDGDTLIADITVTGDDGTSLARLSGLMLRRLDRQALLPPPEEIYRDWLYRLRWQPREAPPAGGTEAGSWLILADAGGLGEALARELEGRGQRCVLAFATRTGEGEAGIAAAGSRRRRLDPERPEAFQSLLDDLPGEDASPWRGVVHLWSLDAARPDELTPESLAASQRLALGSSLRLVQALAAADPAHTRGLRLWWVTRGVHDPAGDAPVSVAPSTLWGFGRTVAQELPASWGGLVDLDPAGSPAAGASRLAAELSAGAPDDQIVLRGAGRWVARLARLTPAEAPPVRVRDDAAYLITGGLGALGLAVARYLVERGARHLALMGRRGPREDAAAAIAELEELGAEVRVVRSDVTHGEEVAAAVADLRGGGRPAQPALREQPPLAGVVHCAGILEDAVLDQLDWARLERVMAPKVQGAWHLHTATLDAELDFFVVFSSVLGLTGSAGQANYTAANAFLDALAAYRRGRGLPALAIAWGPWAEAGLAVSAGRRGEDVWRARGTTYIPPGPGIAVLDELLRHDLHHAAVTITDWSVFVPQLPARSRAFYEELASAPATAATARSDLLARLAAAPPEERRSLLVGRLRAVVGKLLGIDGDDLDPERPFFEYGFDSLMAVQLRNELAQLELSVGLGALGREAGLEQLASEVRTAAGESLETLAEVPGGAPDGAPAVDPGSGGGPTRIVPFEPQHLPALARFSARVWRRPTDDAFLDWRYRACADFHRAWLAVRDGECLATVSALEKSYRVGDERLTVLEGFDWYSLPELTNSGVGIEVMEALHAQPHPVLGIGGTEEAAVLRQRLGWQPVTTARSFVLPLTGDAARAAGRRGVPVPLARVGMALAGRTWFRPRRREVPPDGRVERVAELGGEIEDLYRGEIGYGAAPVADPAYLNWLVGAYPGLGRFQPFYFHLGDTLRGWALGRVYDTADGLVAALVDGFAPRPTVELYTWMVSEVLVALADHAPASVRAAATCPLLTAALRRNRFLPWKTLAVDCFSRGPSLPADVHLTLDVADEAFLPYPAEGSATS